MAASIGHSGDRLNAAERQRLVAEYRSLERTPAGQIRSGLLGDLAKKWRISTETVLRIVREVEK